MKNLIFVLSLITIVAYSCQNESTSSIAEIKKEKILQLAKQYEVDQVTFSENLEEVANTDLAEVEAVYKILYEEKIKNIKSEEYVDSLGQVYKSIEDPDQRKAFAKEHSKFFILPTPLLSRVIRCEAGTSLEVGVSFVVSTFVF